MKESLHLYKSTGETILERELHSEENNLIIVLKGGTVSVQEIVAPEDDVLAALVRDEDGWMLAAAGSDRLICSGAKTSEDLHLTPGLSCRIGDVVFRLEKETAEVGFVLMWRYAHSPVAVDSVVSGRNVFALGIDSKTPMVNPPVVENQLFEFFPTADGLDVATSGNSADRLSALPNTLFSVGRFEGMFLTTAEASKAVRTASPFAWPGRGIRQAALLAMLGVGAVFLVGTFFHRQALEFERLNALPHGAVRVEPIVQPQTPRTVEEITVYNMTFYRLLQVMLTAEPNVIIPDMIQRGLILADDPGVKQKVMFLKDVATIQRTIRTGRWDELKNALAAVDEKVFVECDAGLFLADAREVASLITECLPQKLAAHAANAHAGATHNEDELVLQTEKLFAGLSDNVFMSDRIVKREYEAAHTRIEVLQTYITSRDAVLRALAANDAALKATDVNALYDAFAIFQVSFPEGEEAFSQMVTKETNLMREVSVKTVERILAGEAADVSGAQSVLLEPLASIAEMAGVEEKQIAVWRKKAKFAMRRVNARCRELYSSYRLAVISGEEECEKYLDGILELTEEGSGFGAWARREKERRAKQREEESAAAADKEVSE